MRGAYVHINTGTQDGNYILQHTERSVWVQTEVKHENKAVNGTLLTSCMFIIKILTWLCDILQV